MKINYTEGAGFFTIPGEEEARRIRFLYPCERTGKTYIFYIEPEAEAEESPDSHMSCACLTQKDGQWRLEIVSDGEDWAIIDELTAEMNRAAWEAPDGEEEAVVAAAVKAFVPSEHPVLTPERQRDLAEIARYLNGSTPEERLLNAIFGAVDGEGDGDAADA